MVRLELSGPVGTPHRLHRGTRIADGTILDDEAKVSVDRLEVDEGDALTRAILKSSRSTSTEVPIADVRLTTTFKTRRPERPHQAMPSGGPATLCAAVTTISTSPRPGHDHHRGPHDPLQAVDLPAVQTLRRLCWWSPTRAFWVELSRVPERR